MNRRLHTPDGVRDIIGSEYRQKQSIESQLSAMIERYGYDPIQTPSFEYFDMFGSKMGTTSSKNLYKFFDREGETVVLRPDFTPSVARCAAKYFSETAAPVRLYYKGSVFSNQKSLRGNLNEQTQIGGEYIGDGDISADAEMIAMVIRALIEVGLKDFEITIGHAAVVDGLIKACSLDEEAADEIRSMMTNKNFFGLSEHLSSLDIPDNIRDSFMLLSRMYSSPQEFSELGTMAKDVKEINDAISDLQEMYELLELYGVCDHVSFDLGLVSDLRYYTGVVFLGYSYDSGQPIVKGGRYDQLLKKFGKGAPALGFAIDIDQLLVTLERQKISISFEDKKQVIIYTNEGRKAAIEEADSLRKYGSKVLLVHGRDEEHISALKEEFGSYEIKVH